MIRDILLDILGPILVLVLLGALLRRKFRIDVGTLSKLNLYLFTPAFLFDQVSRSTLRWSAMAGVVGITAIQIATLGGLVWAVGRVFRVHPRTLAAIAMAVMFYNSGNYGLPLAALAFPGKDAGAEVGRSGGGAVSKGDGDAQEQSGSTASPRRDGAAVQAFVVFSVNLLTFTVGLAIAARAGGESWAGGAKALFRLPTLYTIAAALLARAWLQAGHAMPVLIGASVDYLSKALVPTALVTLGAQLAVQPRWPRWRPVSMVLVLRLLFGPVQMAALLFGLHLLHVPALDLWPWPAQSLVLTAGVPTAVNVLLLTLEVGGDADLAADCVFWTTVGSCLTITGWLVAIRTVPWFGG